MPHRHFRMAALTLLLAIAPALAAIEAWLPAVVEIPAGIFICGSDRVERDAAYRLDEAAYGHSVTRDQAWYEGERERGPAQTAAYAITATPITNRQYAVFVAATGHRAPDVDRATWNAYGLIHPYERTRRFA